MPLFFNRMNARRRAIMEEEEEKAISTKSYLKKERKEREKIYIDSFRDTPQKHAQAKKLYEEGKAREAEFKREFISIGGLNIPRQKVQKAKGALISLKNRLKKSRARMRVTQPRQSINSPFTR